MMPVRWLPAIVALGLAVPAWAGGGVVVDRVAIVVNGVPVLASEVARREAQIARGAAELDAAQKLTIMAEKHRRAIDSLVDEALVAAAGREAGVAVLAADVDQALAEIKRQNNLDDAGLAGVLAKEAMSVAEYRDDLERQILLMKTQNVLIGGAVLVAEPAIRVEYDRRKAGGGPLASFADERDGIYRMLYEMKLVELMERWMAEQRKTAHLESKESR